MKDNQRKTAPCMNCGEEREIAAHGLCFTCYRREERAGDNPWAAADKHNRGALKTQRKLRKVVTTILNAVDEGAELLMDQDVAGIRSILRPYFMRMAEGLPEGKSRDDVNSEHGSDVHVHTNDEGLSVNSEHELEVHRSLQKLDPVNSEQISGVHSSHQYRWLQPYPDLYQKVIAGEMTTAEARRIINHPQPQAVNSEHDSGSPVHTDDDFFGEMARDSL